MRHLDLFSGIGGFSLGLERTGGFETVAFCEIDEWCRSQLARNWPGVPVHTDIGELDGQTIGHVDIVTGGFPCQDVSFANTTAKGIDGARSGLVFELLRVIREVRPNWVIIENSPALRVRGADRVLDEMEGQGYTCWPLVVGARHLIAPHRRDRVWIVAHANQSVSERRREVGGRDRSVAGVEGGGVTPLGQRRPLVAHAEHAERWPPGEQGRRVEGNDGVSQREETTGGPRNGDPWTSTHSHGNGVRLEQQRVPERRTARGVRDERQAELALHAHSHCHCQSEQSVHGQMGGSESLTLADGEPWGWWNGGPGAHLSMDDGLSTRVARQWLKAYGNSVVPDIVEALGNAILSTTSGTTKENQDETRTV